MLLKILCMVYSSSINNGIMSRVLICFKYNLNVIFLSVFCLFFLVYHGLPMWPVTKSLHLKCHCIAGDKSVSLPHDFVLNHTKERTALSICGYVEFYSFNSYTECGLSAYISTKLDLVSYLSIWKLKTKSVFLLEKENSKQAAVCRKQLQIFSLYTFEAWKRRLWEYKR